MVYNIIVRRSGGNKPEREPHRVCVACISFGQYYYIIIAVLC